MADIVFNGGDEIVQPFTIDVDGVAVNLTGCTVFAEVWWRDRSRIILSVGTGLEVSSVNPPGDEPHGTVTITELQSATFPRGRIAFLRFVVVSPLGVTTSTGLTYFERRL